jgi:hypothetical protein
MAWKIRTITGGRRLDEDMRLQGTRIISFTVDNPADPEHPFGPFTTEVPAAWSEAQMRTHLDEETVKLTQLTQGS